MCYGLNVCVPPNSYAEILIPIVIIFGSGAFGRQLGLDEVTRWGAHDVSSTLLRRGMRELASLCALPCEDTGRR